MNVADNAPSQSAVNHNQLSVKSKLEGFILSQTSKRQTKYDGED